jgi:hypothetical protein
MAGVDGAMALARGAAGPLEKRGFLPGETIGVGAYAKVKLARSIHTGRKVRKKRRGKKKKGKEERKGKCVPQRGLFRAAFN